MKKSIFLSALFLMGMSLVSCKNEERETTVDEEINPTMTETETMTNDGFAEYDANSDSQWDENEFTESYQGEFSGYDADTSGDLNNEEFVAATFITTDRNRDSSITREEWDAGFRNNYGSFVSEEDYSKFDTDKSGDLSNEEWNVAFTKTTWFTKLDADQNKTVSSEEWNKANFSRWDRNGDGFLNRQEFQAYNQARMSGNNVQGMQNSSNMNSSNSQSSNTTNNLNNDGQRN
ncbi:hypothetical protein [Salinimicrobium oceani]|uniref:EF-hand domain-containing protein n=1 Tax=Salinimicrobium oceani TaxID=2722702 RepID=A0ABX1D0H7_9FLAO|nr:hypothetical protein [Salinimicrobium oceani]NJW52351.1 hypothetical protein [Salinimicrobium oceani]